jgi:hypothetical protein
LVCLQLVCVYVPHASDTAALQSAGCRSMEHGGGGGGVIVLQLVLWCTHVSLLQLDTQVQAARNMWVHHDKEHRS